MGNDPSGGPALPHLDELSAFIEIVAEVDKSRTLLVAWKHWHIQPAPHPNLAPVPGPGVAGFGGEYWDFIPGPAPGMDTLWGTDEPWIDDDNDPKRNLGHVVTAIGYIPAGDPDDPEGLIGNPTNWVIVHDGVLGTARNLILPLTLTSFNTVFVGNTNLVAGTGVPTLPWGPGLAVALGLAAALIGVRARRAALLNS